MILLSSLGEVYSLWAFHVLTNEFLLAYMSCEGCLLRGIFCSIIAVQFKILPHFFRDLSSYCTCC
jgi:hypothetical protein